MDSEVFPASLILDSLPPGSFLFKALAKKSLPKMRLSLLFLNQKGNCGLGETTFAKRRPNILYISLVLGGVVENGQKIKVL